MAIRSVFAFSVLFLFTYCDAKADNCSQARCKLLPLSKGFASEFRSKAVEKGVRMIYLQLNIGNDSYNPLQTSNEFLPYRWVWAPTIGELLLSLSYDYDILSLGLLKRQVRGMDVKLEDEPSGCLAGLTSSCQDIVVARTLLGNVTARNSSSGMHSSKDVVCVAEIDTKINFFENFFEGDVEFRCCKVVDNQGGLNLIPECDLRVQKSNWYKAFYVVLNVLTLFVGLYSPGILLVLPDYLFDLRKEYEKEHQQEEPENERQNGYLPIPSSQETYETITEESIVVTDTNDIASEWTALGRVRRPATLAEDNANVIEELDTNKSNVNEAIENEADLNDPNSNQPNLSEPNSDVSPNSSTYDKGKDEEEERKIDEFPVDDGSPVNISTLLHACASAEVFRNSSTKLSFNIKLAFLWVCVVPFLFYMELALGYILKDEYLEEIGKKDTVVLTGGLFFILDMHQTSNWVILMISYLIIPLLIILILKPKDLSEEGTRDDCNLSQAKSSSSRVFIGDELLQCFKKSKESLLVKNLFIGKVPIHVYQAVQNSCDKCKKTGARRLVRLVWGLLALISSIFAVTCGVIVAAICLLSILLLSTVVLIGVSPYSMILWYFIRYKLMRSRRLIIFFIILIPGGSLMFFFSLFKPMLHMINPLVWFAFAIMAPFYLPFTSCRFVIKMCGYTIMGLIYNAEIAAPIAVFMATLASYLRDRYFDSKNQCKRVKKIISQEWQQGIKDSVETGKLDQQEKPKVTDDAIPKELFWYVCDGDDNRVFSLESETLRLLRDVAIIFFTAFLALCAIFFPTDSYQISTVASAIAVFVSVKIPMVLLRKNDNFNGWEKIKTKRIIRESVGTFIKQRKWLQSADEAMV